jgi:D-threo-aldose 1-dehydrogenase
MSIDHLAARRRDFVTRGGRTLSFSILGFGSAPLGNYLRALSEEDCDKTLTAAWDNGLRYYDTAPLYGFGLSELRVARLLNRKERNDYIISTKVGRILEPCDASEADGIIFVDIPPYRFYYDYSYDGVMRSYEESLKRLRLNHVDILYVHDVDAFNHGGRAGSEARIQELIETGGWRALTELRDNGDVSAIGAGVNEWQPCARLLELVDPDLFLLAGRYTLLEQEPLDTLFPQCIKRGVGIVIGGPYNSGVLAGRTTFNYGDIPADVAAKVGDLRKVCRAHDVQLPQAALHFVLAHPLVVSVIPGTQSVQETEQNVALLDLVIPAAFWDELKTKQLLHPEAPVPSGGA